MYNHLLAIGLYHDTVLFSIPIFQLRRNAYERRNTKTW
nr:MAG TPA: hypothetical protein [Caudoviricetes sp.]